MEAKEAERRLSALLKCLATLAEQTRSKDAKIALFAAKLYDFANALIAISSESELSAIAGKARNLIEGWDPDKFGFSFEDGYPPNTVLWMKGTIGTLIAEFDRQLQLGPLDTDKSCQGRSEALLRQERLRILLREIHTKEMIISSTADLLERVLMSWPNSNRSDQLAKFLYALFPFPITNEDEKTGTDSRITQHNFYRLQSIRDAFDDLELGCTELLVDHRFSIDG